jgi:hypothetical protein
MTSDPVLIGAKLYWVGEPLAAAGSGSGHGYVYGLDIISPGAPRLLAPGT